PEHLPGGGAGGCCSPAVERAAGAHANNPPGPVGKPAGTPARAATAGRVRPGAEPGGGYVRTFRIVFNDQLCKMVRVRDHLTGRDPAAPVLGESRSRVLAALQDAAQPLGVDEVAARARLHPNTIRFHLDALVEAELAERVPEERRSPGRPRALYVTRPGSVPAGSRSYRFLAQILASYIAAQTADPVRAATEAGQEWGRYLAGRPPPFHRSDAES